MSKSILFIILIFTLNEAISQADSLNNKSVIDGEFSLGGAHYSGNLSLFTVKSTFKATIRYNNISSKTYLQYAFNNTFDNVIQNDFYGYDIINIGEEKRFHPKFAGMYEKSKIKSIDNHYVLGLGLGWNALAKEKYKLVVMNTLSFEKKEFLTNKSLNYQGIRYSIILNGEYFLLKNKLIIKHNFFLNPFLFNSKDNYRYRLLIDLLLPISKKISAKISFDYSNESIIDTSLKPENTLTTFGLSVKL